MKNIIKYIAVSLLFLSFASCRKESPNVTNPTDVIGATDSTYWSTVFESYWSGMNHNYAFWDIDTLDWDRIYRVYKPLFAALYSTSPSDSIKAKVYFDSITSPLIDSHYQLTLKGVKAVYVPSEKRAAKRSYYHVFDDSFQTNFVKFVNKNSTHISNRKSYLTINMETADVSFLFTSFLYDKIACMHLSNFHLYSLLSKPDSATVKGVLTNFHNLVKSDQSKAIIIDLRHNGGGYLNDVIDLFSPLIKKDESVVFGYTRQKKSMSRLDYTPLAPALIIGTGEKSYNEKPIVVLVDLHSVSCSEISARVCQVFFKNHYLIGERTWGGQGQLGDARLLSGGQFENSFYKAYTSSEIFYALDKKCYESIGISVDKEVFYNDNKSSFSLGIDNQWNEAVSYLKTKM